MYEKLSYLENQNRFYIGIISTSKNRITPINFYDVDKYPNLDYLTYGSKQNYIPMIMG